MRQQRLTPHSGYGRLEVMCMTHTMCWGIQLTFIGNHSCARFSKARAPSIFLRFHAARACFLKHRQFLQPLLLHFNFFKDKSFLD